MAKLELTDEEMSELIAKIISIGGSKTIIEWLKYDPGKLNSSGENIHKSLSYRGYDINFYGFTHKDGSVLVTALQLSRSPRFLGWIENKKVFKFMKNAIWKNYPSVSIQHWGACQIRWGVEARLAYEAYEAPLENGPAFPPTKDFIIFQFNRDCGRFEKWKKENKYC